MAKITRELVEKDAIPDSRMKILKKLDYVHTSLRLTQNYSTEDLETYVRYGKAFQRAQETKQLENLSSPYGDYMFFYERLHLMEEEIARRQSSSLTDKLEE